MKKEQNWRPAVIAIRIAGLAAAVTAVTFTLKLFEKLFFHRRRSNAE